MEIMWILALYFVPVLTAVHRNSKNVKAIGALNLLLGWTIIGWVAALVWSLVEEK